MVRLLQFVFFCLLPHVLRASEPAEGTENPPPQTSPDQYNIELPTGTVQPLAVYYTKDLKFRVGTTEVGFYGFIKADYLGETRITGSVADVRPDRVPLNSDLADRHSQSLIDARSSRLGFKVEDQFEMVQMKGAVEGDFFTPEGDAIAKSSRLFRLRLAYASGETPSHLFLLVGQYYGLPMHYPEIVMPTRVNLLHYPPGVIDCRQPQFRFGYKQYFAPTKLLQYECNAEAQGYNSLGILTPEGGDIAQAMEQKWPLFNAKVSWLSDVFKWDVCFSGTQAYAIVDSAGARVHTPVWGVASNASITWKNLVLWGTVHHLVGLTGLSSNYFHQLTLVNNQLKAAKANGGCVALRYDFIAERLWTDVMYGVEQVMEIPGTIFSGSALKRLEDFRINLIGAWWNHWQLGVEYERVAVRAYNGESGSDNMVHIAVWYIFGQP